MASKTVLIIVSRKSSSEENIEESCTKVFATHGYLPVFTTVNIPPDIYKINRDKIDAHNAVFVYGGDGTVVAAIKHMIDSPTPLIILPGGTGNLIAKHLGIKADKTKIVLDFCKGHLKTQYFDVAQSSDGLLALDIHIGWWAESTIATPRSLKKRIGILAYGIEAIRKLPTQTRGKYVFTIDGDNTKTVYAYTSLFANKAIQNFLGFKLFNKVERAATLEIAFVTSLNPIRFWVWVVGRLVSGRNVGGFMKTYYARSIEILDSPRKVLFDDEERRMKLPMSISAGVGQTKLYVSSSTEKHGRNYRLVRVLRYFVATFFEQARNTIAGAPLYKYSQVMPKLYVGGSFRKKAVSEFEAWGVQAIVNLRRVRDPELGSIYSTLHLPTTDMHAPSLDNIVEGVAFMEAQINAGRGVYVHCRHGRGRGPTLVAAYLMSEYGMNLKQAIAHLKSVRPMVDILKTQRKRLKEYEKLLKNTSVQ